MEKTLNAVIAAAGGDGLARPGLAIGEDPLFAPDANEDLRIVGTRRANLLLEGSADAIRTALEMLWPEAVEPVLMWSPGQPLQLPPPGRAATLILHDVSELSHVEQHRVLAWLDQLEGRIRVVSTSAVPLWPRVDAGAFNDVLYYRLNTVCVDLGW